MGAIKIINVNGIIFSPEEAKISVMDRGFLYGDSIYETMVTFEGKIFRLPKHMKRLFNSAELMGLKLCKSQSELISMLEETIVASQEKNLKLRLVISRGIGELSLDPTLATQNNIVIIAEERASNPVWWYEKGVKIIITDVLRMSKLSVDPNIKSGNYLNNVLAYRQAKENDAFEAIMLNHSGQVTEATTSNVWLVKNDILYTPPIEEGLLGGITRSTLLERAPKLGLKLQELPLRPQDLLSADEVFLTSTSRFVIPVVQIGEKVIGNGKPGPIAKKLLALCKKEVEELLAQTQNP